MAKDAITLFREAALQLQKEATYLALDHARTLNDNDEKLQDMIGKFNLARMDLNNELTKGDARDQERVTELNEQVGSLYNDIMACESMAAYNEAKDEMEAQMNWVNAIINTAVNGGDPMTVEEPQASCSGSCSSCSGCH